MPVAVSLISLVILQTEEEAAGGLWRTQGGWSSPSDATHQLNNLSTRRDDCTGGSYLGCRAINSHNADSISGSILYSKHTCAQSPVDVFSAMRNELQVNKNKC